METETGKWVTMSWVLSKSSNFFFFCGTRVRIQGLMLARQAGILPLEPLRQPFFVMGFFPDRGS
jgi:hypothetical protein